MILQYRLSYIVVAYTIDNASIGKTIYLYISIQMIMKKFLNVVLVSSSVVLLA